MIKMDIAITNTVDVWEMFRPSLMHYSTNTTYGWRQESKMIND